jgi:hypothetical protein
VFLLQALDPCREKDASEEQGNVGKGSNQVGVTVIVVIHRRRV